MLLLAWPLAVHAAEGPPPGTPAVGEVVVTARKPDTQILLDRKVYNVSHDLQSTAGSAADVLNNLPSVAVDMDGGVSLRGDSNVTILIDGKPSAQFSGSAAGSNLQQFPASQIDRIEVLTSPPAQYKAEGSGGVINIVTKKSHRPGLSGAVRASAGDHGRYVLGLDGAYNAPRLRLSGGVGLRHDVRERLTTSNRLASDPATGLTDQSAQSIDEHFQRLTPSVNATADYDLTGRQTLGASFSHRELTGHRYFDQLDSSGPPQDPPTSISNRHSDGHEWHLDEAEAVHFEQKLRRPGETLTFAVQHSVVEEHELYAYLNTFALPAAPPTSDDLHLGLGLLKTEFSADYVLPLPKDGELKLGYDLEDDRNHFDNLGHDIDPVSGQPIVNPAVTDDFRYRQAVNTGYAQYQASFGRWRLQGGARMEAAHISTLEITGNVPGGRDDFGVYPSLNLERSLGETAKITASASRRINRPDPEALNPFTDYQDVHNLRAGNPGLRPQDTWIFQLGYQSTGRPLTFSLDAYYRIDRNAVTDVVQPVSADVVLDTKENLPESRSGGLEFAANGKLGSKLTYDLSGDAFHTQINAIALGAPGLKSTTGVNLKARLEYRPTPHDTAQISISRQDRRLTPQGYVSPINLVNLGYRHQIRPDLALVATVTDLFNGQTYQRIVTTPVLIDNYRRHQLGRVVLVGLVYNFGGPSKASNGFDYGD